MSEDIRIVEVGPRDGLQAESVALSASIRAEFVDLLVKAGLKSIEVGSFVSPRHVPQMADTAGVLAQLRRPGEARRIALVPNLQGLEAAINAGVDEVAVFASASETFSRRNINCSVDESIERFKPIFARLEGTMPVRGYVSCAFGCPYEGQVPVSAVTSLARRLAELGCYEVSVADTIGVATPRDTKAIAEAVAGEIGASRVALHFHDTRGQALANTYASLETGIRTFDCSVAGLGGCPFAAGATGNVATEDVVYMLHGMGLSTGIDLPALIEAGEFVSRHLGRRTGSRVARAEQARVAA
ncbi:hydroxymethylglutaryl-CoA lyase [Bosea sp. (in: a-proteobacteria)]|jgi:hydroxymethylglutaryl-CoA lyase|uniref:hydroxymethylglutaryl-CoA lyase n=1 Tax=Bosea sp. (in: a-proteobacteria) TaxID=1871050 RepID=UPI003F701D9C